MIETGPIDAQFCILLLVILMVMAVWLAPAPDTLPKTTHQEPEDQTRTRRLQ